MILTGKAISDHVNKKQICIEPFDKNLLNPNSYNYRLGSEIYEFKDEIIDPRLKPNLKKINFGPEGYELKPNKLYLAHTMEKIGSEKFVTSLIGRSSLGRLGLFLQITADLGQLGKAHCWTLELKVVQPLVVYPGMKIGQVSFWAPEGECSPYIAGYTNFNQPHSNRHIKEINL